MKNQQLHQRLASEPNDVVDQFLTLPNTVGAPSIPRPTPLTIKPPTHPAAPSSPLSIASDLSLFEPQGSISRIYNNKEDKDIRNLRCVDISYLYILTHWSWNQRVRWPAFKCALSVPVTDLVSDQVAFRGCGGAGEWRRFPDPWRRGRYSFHCLSMIPIPCFCNFVENCCGWMV